MTARTRPNRDRYKGNYATAVWLDDTDYEAITKLSIQGDRKPAGEKR